MLMTNRGSMSNVMLSIMTKPQGGDMDTAVNTLESAKPNGSGKSKQSEETAKMQARIKELEAKLEAADKAANAKLQMKVSEKKAASLIGLQRWPVTLYYGQWKRIIANISQIDAWLEAHKAELSMGK